MKKMKKYISTKIKSRPMTLAEVDGESVLNFELEIKNKVQEFSTEYDNVYVSSNCTQEWFLQRMKNNS